ncbi:hypothetical protein [Klebsiella pneumoniae]|nr:hypothetical protein [Klebsiella pneumoniae]
MKTTESCRSVALAAGGRRPLSRAIGGLTALGCIVVWQSEY